jgi:c-di-GMP-binding flagellar brake protein YcgR
LTINQPVEIYDILNDKHIKGTIIDISAGGMAIIVDEYIELKTPISLKFNLSHINFEHIQADVIRVHKYEHGNKYCIGVKFHNLDKKLENEINRFVLSRTGQSIRAAIKGQI